MSKVLDDSIENSTPNLDVGECSKSKLFLIFSLKIVKI